MLDVTIEYDVGMLNYIIVKYFKFQLKILRPNISNMCGNSNIQDIVLKFPLILRGIAAIGIRLSHASQLSNGRQQAQ